MTGVFRLAFFPCGLPPHLGNKDLFSGPLKRKESNTVALHIVGPEPAGMLVEQGRQASPTRDQQWVPFSATPQVFTSEDQKCDWAGKGRRDTEQHGRAGPIPGSSSGSWRPLVMFMVRFPRSRPETRNRVCVMRRRCRREMV